MAQSILALKTRGNGFPQLYTVVAGTASAFGNTFLTQLIGAVGGGVFAPGDTVTYDGGTHTALVTQFFVGRLILNSMSAGWAPGAGTITNGAATATAAGVEGVEAVGTANYRRAHARVIQFKNQIFCTQYNTIYRFNPVTNNVEEVYRYTLFPFLPNADSASQTHLGLYNLNINGVPHLVTLYGDKANFAGIVRVKSSDGATWSEAQISALSRPIQGDVTGSVWGNVLYFYSSVFTGSQSWDPGTDGYSQVARGGFTNNVKFVVWKNRFFAIQQINPPTLYELSGGAWNLSAVAIPNYWPTTSNYPFVSPDSGDLVMFLRDNLSGAIKAIKWTMSAGVVQPATDLPAVCPSAFGTSNLWEIDGYIDQEANALAGGPAVGFVWTAPDDVAGSTRSYWEYVNDTTAMNSVGAPGAPVEIALPNLNCGGGDRSFFPGELDVDILASMTPVTGGERITSFVIYPWPMNTTIAVASNGQALPFGTVNVASTAGFPPNGALYVTTGAGVQTVQYTGITPTSFTGCTGGTGVMATGGAVKYVVINVKLKIVYGNKGHYPLVGFATLSNPSNGSLNGTHEVDGLVADGTTVNQVTELLVSADGQANFSNIQRDLIVFV